MRDLIERHGGINIHIVECCSYQIYPEQEPGQTRDEHQLEQEYNRGRVYSSKWLYDSISKQTLLNPSDYLKYHC